MVVWKIFSNLQVLTSKNDTSKRYSRENERKNLMEKLIEIFKKYADDLSPRERDVVRLAFGLDDGRMRGFTEIGQLFTTNAKEIAKICNKALNKMPEFLTVYEECDEEEWRIFSEKKMADRTNSRVRFLNGKEL